MRTVTPVLINRYIYHLLSCENHQMGYNLEGKADFANSGPWCQLTLVTGWVKGKLGGQSRRVDHCISLEPVRKT